MSAALINAFSPSWGRLDDSSGNRSLNAVIRPVPIPQPSVSPTSTASDSPWLSATKTKLQELIVLPQNWDGRGSGIISPDTTNFALTMLAQVMPPTAPAPSIVPLGRGELQLLWHNIAGELEVEVVKPNDVAAYHLDHSTGQEQEWRMTTDFSLLSDILWSMLKD